MHDAVTHRVAVFLVVVAGCETCHYFALSTACLRFTRIFATRLGVGQRTARQPRVYTDALTLLPHALSYA